MTSRESIISTTHTQDQATTQVSSTFAKIPVLRAVLMWGLAAVFYFYDYLLQVSPSAMKPELMQSLVSDAEAFGSLSAYCLFAYGIMQIPAGMLLDRYGPRKIITLACTLCAAGSIVFGVSTELWQAKLGRVLIGAGAGVAFLSCLKIVHLWFPRQRYALMTGTTVTVGFLGAVFGLSSVSKIVEITGWRSSMYWGGLIGLILSVFLWYAIKEVVRSPKIIEEHKQSSIVSDLKVITKDSQTWILAIFAGLMFVPTLAFGGLWGIPFLVEAHGFDRTFAGMCTSLIYVGFMFGGTFWGFVSDYWGRRNAPMLIANVATLLVTIAIIYGKGLSPFALQSLLFALGFFSSGCLVAFAVATELHPSRLSGTASGFTNAVNTLWGALAQPFIGWILDLNSSGSAVMVSGERVFTLAEYQNAFLVLPICLVVSCIFLLILKETYCKPKQS